MVKNKNNKDYEEFVLRGTVMIWSFGPDRQMHSKAGALAKENTDNILGWR